MGLGALLSLHKQRPAFEAMGLGVRLSGVIKLARLMVIRHAHEARQQSIARKVERGTSQMHAEEESPSHVQLVQGMTQRFMMLMGSEGQPTPMDWMLDTRTYGMHV